MSRKANHERESAQTQGRLRQGTCSIRCFLSFILLTIILIAVPVCAGSIPGSSPNPAEVHPESVNISIYVADFHRFDVGAGTVGVDFYLTLKSNNSISINDLELMNGMITSVSTIRDTPNEKEYRVVAVLTAEPDLRRYPFDQHTLSIRFEPKVKTEREMVLVVDQEAGRIDSDANVPGWEFSGMNTSVTNKSYLEGEVPYSRAVFEYGIIRDVTSTILKLFLPLMLIIIVSLSSLMMKVSSRLGLNASMFLAAVLIHWRMADAIPLVAYATFLDLFMVITYATLVMVLISGIMVLKFSEAGNSVRIGQINYWSIRIIPLLCLSLYFLLFLSLFF